MIPFFVADRPVSLKILRGSNLEDYSIKAGLMSHANTSRNFQELFSLYPCTRERYCEIARGKCPFGNSLERCRKGSLVRKNLVKMCDSGMFQKRGCQLRYEELFSIYENMKPVYGVIIDYLKQKDKTIRSAKEAYELHAKGDYSFELVGVAQGTTAKEYVECYRELKNIGYSHIAVGGLLRKAKNSARFVMVHSEQLLDEVFSSLRDDYPNEWLFALGCYRLKRHEFLSKMGIFGSDYKGWIFNYDVGRGKKDATLTKDKTELRTIRFRQTRQHIREVYRKVQLFSLQQLKENTK